MFLDHIPKQTAIKSRANATKVLSNVMKQVKNFTTNENKTI